MDRFGNRLDRFWEAHLLRGKAEAYTKGLVVETFAPDSPADPEEFMPLAVVKKAWDLFDRDGVRGRLVALRRANPEACEAELAELIELRFGPWLARNICTHLGVNQFACIVLAISVANGIPPVSPSEHD